MVVPIWPAACLRVASRDFRRSGHLTPCILVEHGDDHEYVCIVPNLLAGSSQADITMENIDLFRPGLLVE